jgi:peptide/nickel transport system substrate-binding protein
VSRSSQVRRRVGLVRNLAVLAVAGGVLAAGGCRRDEPSERPLRIALYDGPSSRDPHEVNEFLTFTVLAHLYEPLVTLDADLRVQPALAERWDNPDERTWRFFLRHGARFHDGRPLTAADVVASVERVRNHPAGDFASYIVGVTSVRALDPNTVEIVTERPAAVLLRKLAFLMVVPADAPAEIEEPIGTGPYRLVSWEPGRIELVAFDGHWAGAPPIRHVQLVAVVDAAQRAARLNAGEVELAQALPAAEAAKLEGAAGVRVALREGLAVEYLAARVDRPPLDDPRVRQALSLAVDRQALVDDLLRGYGRPTAQIVPSMAVGYDPALPGAARDVAAARRLLAEAGWPEGVDVELEYRAGRNLEPLRRQAAEAGIRIQLVPRSWDELYERVEAGEATLHYAAVVTETADAADVLDSMAHSRQPDRGWGADNLSGYASRELDALIEQSSLAIEPLERRQILQRCLGILARDLTFIPLLVPHEVYGVRQDLVWEPRLDGNVLAQEMSWR